MTRCVLVVTMAALLGAGCSTTALPTDAASTTAPTTVELVPVVEKRLGFVADDEIEILEVVGSRPRLEVGGVYLLTGRYALRSRPAARIALYSTATVNTLRTHGYKSQVVEAGNGRFHFAFALLGDGDLHISVYEADDEYGNGPGLGHVYFRSPDRAFLYLN